MDKSFSESNLNELNVEITPPRTFVSQRVKRRREEDYPGLDSLKDEIIKLSSLVSSQRTELQTIKSTLGDIKKSNINIENSVVFLTKQNEELQSKVNLLEVQSKKDREYITILEDKMEDIQRSSRKNCLQIKNVPKKSNETKQDLIDMVINLSEKINNKIEKAEIKDIYRIKERKGVKNPPIIIETGSTIIKNDILKACKTFNMRNKEKLRAKELGFRTEENTPIYVSEQLTSKGARLFFLARDLSASKKYRFVWTSFGKIYVRKDENSPVIQIRNESQINQMMQNI